MTIGLSSEFWDAYKGLVVVGDGGAIAFTRVGRKRFAPLLARYGFALDSVRTVKFFCQVMSRVNGGELKANTRAFEEVLQDPRTSEAERELIRHVLAHGIQSTE